MQSTTMPTDYQQQQQQRAMEMRWMPKDCDGKCKEDFMSQIGWVSQSVMGNRKDVFPML